MEQNEVWTVDPSQIIIPGNYPYPKEGHIGYVKFENADEIIRQTNPKWIDVDY